MIKRFHGFKSSLIFLFFLFLIPLLGVAASPTTVNAVNSTIQDIQFVSQGIGWVNINGSLFWTKDDGAEWNNISPENGKIQAAYFLNQSIGFAAAASTDSSGVVNYTIYRTEDSGNHWDGFTIGSYNLKNPLASSEAMHLYFLNENTGWVVIKQQSSSNFNIGVLFKSTDGGRSWQELSIPVGEEVMFINQSVGFVAGGLNDDLLYRTEDGGATWQIFDPSPDSTAKFSLPGFTSLNNGALIVLEDSSTIKVFESGDQGKTWTETATWEIENQGSNILNSLVFSDEIFIASSAEHLTFGQTSKQFESNPNTAQGTITKLKGESPDSFYGISTETICADPGNGASCEAYQDLVYSTDLGKTWRAIPKPIILQEAALDSTSSFETNVVVLDYPRTSLLSGQGFDVCEIPDLWVLNNWKNNSPYTAVNLYIGGPSRACANTNLSIDFVQALSIQGWKFIPTWVGHQAACTNFSYTMSNDPNTAEGQGADNAIDAARIARKLGLGAADDSGTVIYFDLEAFDSSDTKCLNAAKAFLNGWVTELHAHGIMAGLYGSTCGSALAEFATIDNPPDVIWPAIWNGFEYDSNVSLFGLTCLSDNLWNQQERIRQYSGGHNEFWGVAELNIDSNIIDGVVADISDYVGIPTSSLENASFETGILTPWEINQSSADCTWNVSNVSDARTGEYVLGMSKSPAQTNCTGVSQSLTLTPAIGDKYRFAIWARSTSPIEMRSVRLKISAEGSTTESTNQKFSGIDDVWQCLELSHTIQNANLSNLTTEVILENSDGIEVLLDDAHLSLNTASLCPTVPLPSDVDAGNARRIDFIPLSWDPVPDATYYKVFRSDSKNGAQTFIGNSFNTFFRDYDGNFLDVYFYWIKACNAGKCSPLSSYDAGSFSTPFQEFADDFETGEVARWYNTFSPASINTCASNPINGAYSLCADANTTSNAYLVNILANPTDRINVSFRFDPNNANLSTRTYTIFRGVSSEGIAFQLKLIYESSSYKVFLQWYSGGVLESSPLITIPNAPASYQISWNSSAVHARAINTFRQLNLSINNVEKFSTQNIDNGGILVNKFLLGILPNTSTNVGSGTIIFDDFKYTGPQYIR